MRRSSNCECSLGSNAKVDNQAKRMSGVLESRSRRCARRALMLVGANVTLVLLVVLWGFVAGWIVGHGDPIGVAFAWGYLMLLGLIPAGILFLGCTAIGVAYSIMGLRSARRNCDVRYAKRNKLALSLHAGPPLAYVLYLTIDLLLRLLGRLVWG
jgi:hypothetical protein